MMTKSPRKSLLWATLAVLLAARVGVAQNPPPTGPPAASNPAASPTTPPAGEQKPATPPSAQNKISTTTAVVVVPVTVKDKQGNMVAGLRRDDFRVFEDKI